MSASGRKRTSERPGPEMFIASSEAQLSIQGGH